jgi:glycosyltransferase involved in cell wall biosynthesis
LALGRARHVFCPSTYLREIALRWGLEPSRVSVLPNPAPELPLLPSREELRSELGLEGRVLAFAGRLGPQKSLGVALDALAQVPGVTLAIAGDGPERPALERQARELGLDGRTSFLGSLQREAVLRLFRAADASLLSSSWENFPHTVLEALAVGTPVIATSVGGVPEVVRDRENGLLVPSGNPDALADAIGRFFADEDLRRNLVDAARGSVSRYTEKAVFSRIEQALEAAAR